MPAARRRLLVRSSGRMGRELRVPGQGLRRPRGPKRQTSGRRQIQADVDRLDRRAERHRNQASARTRCGPNGVLRHQQLICSAGGHIGHDTETHQRRQLLLPANSRRRTGNTEHTWREHPRGNSVARPDGVETTARPAARVDQLIRPCGARPHAAPAPAAGAHSPPGRWTPRRSRTTVVAVSDCRDAKPQWVHGQHVCRRRHGPLSPSGHW